MAVSAPTGLPLASPPVDRASPNDMMQLASEVGSVPMQVGAVLVFEPGGPCDLERIRGALAARIEGVPRLRQRLVPTPLGCGRPVWVDDATFDVGNHIHTRPAAPPGGDVQFLDAATDILGARLPSHQPPWSATFVTGLRGDGTALVIVFNHVLADGIGGLAVLASLVDGMPPPVPYGFPRPAPSTRAVALDALRGRVQAIGSWRTGLRRVRDALAELRPSLRAPKAPATSLNRPTGSRRATRLVRADLAAVRGTAHRHGATVNDVVLAAVTGSMRRLLVARGEGADRFVVSIPISGRRSASAQQLGNDVGVLPADLPAAGSFADRLVQIAAVTKRGKEAAPAGASAVIVGPLLRAMAVLGLLRPFLERQRMINTIVTNLRGPDARLALGGAVIGEVIPVSIVTGNVTVGFAVLSYAGTVVITINADADRCPDLDALAAMLQDELDAALGAPAPAATAPATA